MKEPKFRRFKVIKVKDVEIMPRSEYKAHVLTTNCTASTNVFDSVSDSVFKDYQTEGVGLHTAPSLVPALVGTAPSHSP